MATTKLDVQCKDCWSEALISVGIYSFTLRVPSDKRREVEDIYENWFYRSHDLGNERIMP